RRPEGGVRPHPTPRPRLCGGRRARGRADRNHPLPCLAGPGSSARLPAGIRTERRHGTSAPDRTDNLTHRQIPVLEEHMKVGDIANEAALPFGRPLEGVRVLALEQMQALPYATQLLARQGDDVVKVEDPRGGDSGRGSLPAMVDTAGRSLG